MIYLDKKVDKKCRYKVNVIRFKRSTTVTDFCFVYDMCWWMVAFSFENIHHLTKAWWHCCDSEPYG